MYEGLHEKPPLTKSHVTLNSPGGALTLHGYLTTTITFKGTSYEVTIHVVKESVSCLLGRTPCSRMGFVKRIEQVLMERGRTGSQPSSKVNPDANESQNEESQSVNESVGLLKGDPVQIKLVEGARSYCVSTARRVPIPLLPKVKKELSRMENLDVIETITEPTEWCAPMVPVIKKNADVRICVDLKRLNQSVLRERYIIPTREEVLSELSSAKVFTSLDGASGFWQIPLDKDSQKLTTFISPFGRYCFKRLHFGISSAPEIFQRRMSELLRDLEGVVVYLDDILVHGSDIVEHDKRLESVMRTINEAGLKLNYQKCKFRQSEIKFLGQIVSASGVRVDDGRVKAITELEAPTNVSELRRVLGMFNYLGAYLEHLSTVLQPLNELLKSDTVWVWGAAQETAFTRAKTLLSSAPILAHYDPKRETVVAADASSYGIGGSILQYDGSKLRPVAFCSRTLSPAEKGYSQIEKECLASVWTCERFDKYLCGLKFTLLTDHRPLVPLMNSRDLDKVPVRCQRLLMRLLQYRANTRHVPGKDLVIADTLSRAPLDLNNASKSVVNSIHMLNEEVELYVNNIHGDWAISDSRLDAIREAIQCDDDLSCAFEYTKTGWPAHLNNVSAGARPYYPVRAHLSVVDGLLIHDNRVVIPGQMRGEILRLLHEGHQGLNKCKEHACMSVWWPGISTELKDIVQVCKHCQVNRPAQIKEPLMPSPLPQRPWQKLGTDILEYNKKKYLVIVDYFSRFIEIEELGDTTTAGVIDVLTTTFATFGIPEVLVSDNGPQFSSKKFGNFAEEYGFLHTTSSPHFAPSNGQAERSVQIAQNILKLSNPRDGLLAYRSTPHCSTGFPPAQLLMGRNIRTKVPMLASALEPRWPNMGIVNTNDQYANTQSAKYYNAKNGVRPLSALGSGDLVRTKTCHGKVWGQPGKIIGPAGTPRSVLVGREDGYVVRRNRHDVKPILSPSPGGTEPNMHASSPGVIHQNAQASNSGAIEGAIPCTTTPVSNPSKVASKGSPLCKPLGSPPTKPSSVHVTSSPTVTRSGRHVNVWRLAKWVSQMGRLAKRAM